jgi:hypothetical protein
VNQPSVDLTQLSEVAGVIKDLYAALGNRAEFDRHLDPAVTIWESDADGLLEGIADLDQLRDNRAARQPTGAARPVVAAEELRADVWGEIAVARYVLRARYQHAADSDHSFRVTDVLHRGPAGWRIVHHHSEALH